MINVLRISTVAMVFLASWLPAMAATPLQLPRIFSDNMVLQRNIPIKIWGWSNPGQEVSVSFAGQQKTAQTDPTGRWDVVLEALPANAQPAELIARAAEKTVTVKNILVGEVWVCSGQSNMEWPLSSTAGAEAAIQAANHPLIRHFKVALTARPKVQKDVTGSWAVCSPATAAKFSAVGYYFGLQLLQKLDVPIGLLNTSWGGTRIEPWTDPEGFAVSPKLKDISDRIAGADGLHRKNLAASLDQIEEWVKKSRETLARQSDLLDPAPRLPEHPLSQSDRPTALYNAMVAPLVPYGIRGAIWYQGESNNGEGMLYFEKMKALTSSWRRIWGLGDFPFFYVQLAPFRYNRPNDLPEIWEAQQEALSIPNTGMAVITDIGNVSDIHPTNKAEVGRRLSLWALAKTYGQTGLEVSGPVFKSMKVEGRQAVLTFTHAEGLKSIDGKPLSWFTIAGSDKKFFPAQAEIQGDTVKVSCAEVETPAAVRLGWHETAEPNLANGAGLPASPFRTDR